MSDEPDRVTCPRCHGTRADPEYGGRCRMCDGDRRMIVCWVSMRGESTQRVVYVEAK